MSIWSFHVLRPNSLMSSYSLLSLTPHTQSASKFCGLCFQNKRRLWPLLSISAVTNMGPATILSLLDYLNSLLNCLLCSLQSVLCKSHSKHIMSLPAKTLQWLPIVLRGKSKFSTKTERPKLVPYYLSDLPWGSEASGFSLLFRTKGMSCFRAFALAFPSAWVIPPLDIQMVCLLTPFKPSGKYNSLLNKAFPI